MQKRVESTQIWRHVPTIIQLQALTRDRLFAVLKSAVNSIQCTASLPLTFYIFIAKRVSGVDLAVIFAWSSAVNVVNLVG